MKQMSWSNIIILVILWLLLKIILDAIFKVRLETSIFSLFFYIGGVISGAGVMCKYNTRRKEKRQRIMELVKAIKETYEA